MRKRNLFWITILLLTACSGLTTLTPSDLERAETRWKASKPASYRLVIAMEGDRVERGEFMVHVKDGIVADLQRNGQPANPASGQDYSMDGLFKIIHEEVELAKTPTVLGAPPGYSVYLMASFDSSSGRLKHYRRAIGGGSNSIDIEVLDFEAE